MNYPIPQGRHPRSMESGESEYCIMPEKSFQLTPDQIQTNRMQWTELLVTCPVCRDQNRVVLPTDKCNLVCRSCGGSFEDIQVIPICGFVYVLSNPRIPGLLKIGYTERSVKDRAAEVSSGTGIPEPFVVGHFCVVQSITR